MSKKILIVLLAIAGAAIIAGVMPASVKAITIDEIKQQIATLQAQITQLLAQLAEQGGSVVTPWCHTFNANLGMGSTGEDIKPLQEALIKDGSMVPPDNTVGFGAFNEYIASAVVGFQEKYANEILKPYGLAHGTGYVGKSTRAKLNKLYGCGQINPIQPVGCTQEGGIDSRSAAQGGGCCSGLSAISPNYTFDPSCNVIVSQQHIQACTYCGNGVCGKGENTCNCPSDCKPEQAVGGFSVSKDSTCYDENGNPIVYYFYSEDCPHCAWETPIIDKVVAQFGGSVFYRKINTQVNGFSTNQSFIDIFHKYSKNGGVPTLALGCKYYREGSGEAVGATQETANLTSLLCKLTNNQPASACGTTTKSITVVAPKGGEVLTENSKVVSSLSSVDSQNQIFEIKWTGAPDSFEDVYGTVNPARIAAYLEQNVNGQYNTIGRIIPQGYGSIMWVVGIVSDTSCLLNNHDATRYSNHCYYSQRLVSPGIYNIKIVDTQTNASGRSNSFTISSASTTPTACTDSDGYKNFHTKGKVFGRHMGETKWWEDYCINGTNTVYDFTCRTNVDSTSNPIDAWADSYVCPNGCSNGACIALPAQNAVLIISPNGGEKWEIGKSYDIKWKTTGAIATDSKVDIDLVDYALSDQTKIIAIAHGVSIANNSYTWNITNSFIASNYPPGFESGGVFKVKITEVKSNRVYGLSDTSDNYFTISNAVPPACADTDGGKDYYTRGSCSSGNTGMGDYCSYYASYGRAGLLKEASCGSTGCIREDYACKTGEICRAGKCIQGNSSDPICVETDGGANAYLKGNLHSMTMVGADDSCYVSQLQNQANGTLVSSCSSGTVGGGYCGVYEYYCTSADYSSSKFIECPQGCSNGACIGESAKSITLVSPNGGETLVHNGSPFQISWRSTNALIGDYVKLFRIWDLQWGSSEQIATNLPVSGSFSWVPQIKSGGEQITGVDSTGDRSNSGYIEARLYNGSSYVKDLNDNPFRINTAGGNPLYVKVISPNGGENLEIGKTYTIKWTSSEIPSSEMVQIVYRPMGRSSELGDDMIAKVANSGSYNWTVPNGIQVGQYKVGMRVNNTYDYSDNYFNITSVASPVTCTDSDGGKSYFTKGTTTWGPFSSGMQTATDGCDVAGVTLSEMYCSGNYSTVDYYTCPNGCSNGACNSQPQKSISITSPNGGETFQPGQNYFIKWDKSGNIGNVSVNLNNYSCADSITLASSVAPVTYGNSYLWKVPQDFFGQKVSNSCPYGWQSGDKFKIMVSENISLGSADESNNYFSIVKPDTASVKVLYPNGGETINAGGIVHLQWQAQGISKVFLYLKSGNMGYYIATSVDAVSGSYDWAIPSDFFLENTYFLAGNNFKIGAYNYLGESGGDNLKDESDSNFSITGASLPICTDTDDGIKYDVKGIVDGLNDFAATVSSTSTDYCSDQNNLVEYSCGFYHYRLTTNYTCPNGCSNGACSSQPNDTIRTQ